MSAYEYGRNAEPLPDIHIFSKLSEIDGALARDLKDMRVREQTLRTQILALAEQLASPLGGEMADKSRGMRK